MFVTIKPSKGKGSGLFALQDIPEGTRILAETPLVALPLSTHRSENDWMQFATMSAANLAKFQELAYAESAMKSDVKEQVRLRLSKTCRGKELEERVANETTLRAIFNTNCGAMGAKCQWGAGVFELYSRINHSCVPNVNNIYSPEIRRETVHAIRDIVEGEELLTSYTPSIRPRDFRQGDLSKYGFECTCEACHGPHYRIHEKRRQRLSDIDQQFALQACGIDSLAVHDLFEMLGIARPKKHGGRKRDLERSFLMAKENVRLLEEEGLCGMDLAVGLRDCAKICADLGKLEDALEYAKKERKVEIVCLGSEMGYMEGREEYAITRIRSYEKQLSTKAGCEGRHKSDEGNSTGKGYDISAQKATSTIAMERNSESTSHGEMVKTVKPGKNRVKKQKRMIGQAAEALDFSASEIAAIVTDLTPAGSEELVFQLKAADGPNAQEAILRRKQEESSGTTT